MNDGSAIVFHNIFSARFLFELGINGAGEKTLGGEKDLLCSFDLPLELWPLV